MTPLGCTTVGYLRAPLERALEGISNAGLRYVELAAIPGYCEHVDVAGSTGVPLYHLRGLLATFGLSTTSVSAHSNLALTAGADHVRRAIDFAAALEATVVNTGVGRSLTQDHEKAIKSHLENLGKYAADTGVVIGVETQNAVFTSGERMREFLASVNVASIGVNLDPGNVVYWWGRRPEQELAAIADKVVHVHVKDHLGGRGDYHFPPVGQGSVDFDAIFRELHAAGFSGTLSVEPELHGIKADPIEIAETREDPGSVYTFLHSYLGSDDPRSVDADLAASLQHLATLEVTIMK